MYFELISVNGVKCRWKLIVFQVNSLSHFWKDPDLCLLHIPLLLQIWKMSVYHFRLNRFQFFLLFHHSTFQFFHKYYNACTWQYLCGCPPKVHVLNAWLFKIVLLGGYSAPLVCGGFWEIFRSLGVCPQRDWGIPTGPICVFPGSQVKQLISLSCFLTKAPKWWAHSVSTLVKPNKRFHTLTSFVPVSLKQCFVCRKLALTIFMKPKMSLNS